MLRSSKSTPGEADQRPPLTRNCVRARSSVLLNGETTSNKLTAFTSRLTERDVPHDKIDSAKDLKVSYDFGRVLGQGVFGTVIEMRHRNTHKLWAVKIIDKQQAEKGLRGKVLEREIQILKLVDHPHIVYLDRVYESAKRIYLIMEKCNMELAALLKEKTVFSEAEARKVLQGLSSAVAYLHKHEIVHRDIKLENIMTSANPDDVHDPLYIKVTDFGLAIVKTGSRPGDLIKEKCGTLTYMAPEIISRQAYTHQCDVWAMGVLTYVLLFGHYPFFSTKDKDLQQIICSTEPTYSGFAVSNDAKRFIRQMLSKNPALRITAAEISIHPWVCDQPPGASPDNILDMMQMWRKEMSPQSTSNVIQMATSIPTTSNSGNTHHSTTGVGFGPGLSLGADLTKLNYSRPKARIVSAGTHHISEATMFTKKMKENSSGSSKSTSKFSKTK